MKNVWYIPHLLYLKLEFGLATMTRAPSPCSTKKVERFEFLVAKRPVPRDISVGPRAPALMMFDLSSRLEQAAVANRRKREVREKLEIFVYAICFFKPDENAFTRIIRAVHESATSRILDLFLRP